jgi:DNA modification methylase
MNNHEERDVGHLSLNRIYLGDSFELDERIPDKSIDMILEDMPYG